MPRDILHSSGKVGFITSEYHFSRRRLQGSRNDGFFVPRRAILKKQEVNRMTMVKKNTSVWSYVSDERDVDDLIFGTDTNSQDSQDTCSER